MMASEDPRGAADLRRQAVEDLRIAAALVEAAADVLGVSRVLSRGAVVRLGDLPPRIRFAADSAEQGVYSSRAAYRAGQRVELTSLADDPITFYSGSADGVSRG